MKKIIVIIIYLSLNNAIFSQNSIDIGKICLGVVVPDKIEHLDASQIAKLKTKIEQICVKNGVASGYATNGFYVYPIFQIYENEMIEGGMQNIFSVKVQMTLFIKQLDGTIVNSINKTFRGNGKSVGLAIVNAIANISTSDADYQKLITEGKDKIISYYETRCGQIIAKAENLAKQEKFEDAIIALMNIPEEVTCYAKAAEKSAEIFGLCQDQLCAKLVSSAKEAIAI